MPFIREVDVKSTMTKQTFILLIELILVCKMLDCGIAGTGDGCGERAGFEFTSKGIALITVGSSPSGISYANLAAGCVETAIAPASDSCDIYVTTDSIFAPLGMFEYIKLDQTIGTMNTTVPCDSCKVIYDGIQKICGIGAHPVFKAKIKINVGYYVRCKYSEELFIVPIGKAIGDNETYQFFWGTPLPTQ